MSESVEILRNAVEPLGVVYYANDVLVTGASLTVSIARTSDSLKLDFADNTFKSSPGTPTHAVSETVAGVSGIYEYVWDTGTIVNPVGVGVLESYTYVILDVTNSRALDDASGSLRLRASDAIYNAIRVNVVVTGTASAGASTSITLAGASSTDNLYRYSWIVITGGTGLGQTRTCLYYVGSTKVATVGRAWTTTPDSTSTFAVIPAADPTIMDSGIAQAGAASTITLNSSSSAVTDYYVGAEVYIVGNTGAGQAPRVITAYNGSTFVATLASAWATNPDSTSVYLLLPIGRAVTVSNLDKTGYSLTGAEETAIANAVLGTVVPGAFGAGTVGALVGTNLNAPIALRAATAQAGTSNSITLDASASAVDNYYRWATIAITGGTGAGQAAKMIAAYVGSTKVATVLRPWTTTPDSTSVFEILAIPQPALLETGQAQSGGASTVQLIAAASSVDNTYRGKSIAIVGGTGGGQERNITSYVGSTQTATVDEAWTTNPDSTSVYLITFGHARAGSVSPSAITSAAFATGAVDANAFAQAAADKVWSTATRTITGTASGAITAASFAASAITSSAFTQGAADLVWNSTTRTLSAGAIVAATYASGAITAAAFATGALGAVWDELKSGHTTSGTYGLVLASTGDAMTLTGGTITSVQSGLATSSALSTVQTTLNTVNVNVAALPSAATITSSVWSAALPGAFGAGTAGKILGSNLDVVLSTVPGLTWDALTSAHTVAGSYGLLLANNLNATLSSLAATLTAIEGSGFTGGTDDLHSLRAAVTGVASGVWSTAVPGSFGAGTAGAVLANRAAPGDAMSLVSNAVTSAVLAASALTAIQAKILSDATPFAGALIANLDAAVTSRASAVQAAELLGAIVAAAPTAATGSTSTVVRSSATQATSFYNGLLLVAINAAGVAARRISSYANTNGAFTLDSALPFTPSASDQLYVIAAPASLTATQVENAVWDATAASHVSAGAMGALEGNLTRLDVASSTLATATALAASITTIDGHTDTALAALQSHGDATWSTATPASIWSAALPGAFGAGTAGFLLGTNLDALVSSRLPTSSYTAPPSAVAISTQVGADLSATHGAGTWITAAGFSVPGSAMTLTSGERTTMAGVVAALDISGYSNLLTLGGALTAVRRFTTWTPATLSKKVYNVGTGKMDVYGDDGVTLLYSVPLHDATGGAVVPVSGDVWEAG